MTRLIDADALRAWFSDHSVYDEFPVGYIMGLLDDQPTVDALPYDYILNIEEELRQKARESESQERKDFYTENAEAIRRLLITWEVKGRGTVRAI